MNKKSACYYIIVIGLMYIITAAILSIAAAIIWKSNASAGAVSIAVVIAYILSNFIGGFLTGKKVKKYRFLWGIAVSCVYFIILLLIGVWFMGGKINLNSQLIGNALMCIVAGMFGGMLAPFEADIKK